MNARNGILQVLTMGDKSTAGWLPPQWWGMVGELEERYNPGVFSNQDLGEIFSSSYTKGAVGVYTNQSLYGYLLFDSTRWTLRLLSLFVLPAFRKRGVGSELLRYLQQSPITASYKGESCLIRESNKIAQRFLTKNGFKATLLSGAFSDPGEDGYMFSRPHRRLQVKNDLSNVQQATQGR